VCAVCSAAVLATPDLEVQQGQLASKINQFLTDDSEQRSTNHCVLAHQFLQLELRHKDEFYMSDRCGAETVRGMAKGRRLYAQKVPTDPGGTGEMVVGHRVPSVPTRLADRFAVNAGRC
jgi:hypothetical protein